MTFKERLNQIDRAEQDSALAKLETAIEETTAELPPPPHVEEGTPVHCSECGNNTLREEHNAIMCTNCGHGPFCNYCWKAHIRDFHPLLVQPYEDAARGIRRRARFFNHYLIRTVLKPAGIALGLASLIAVVFFVFQDRDATSAATPPAVTNAGAPASPATTSAAATPETLTPPTSIQPTSTREAPTPYTDTSAAPAFGFATEPSPMATVTSTTTTPGATTNIATTDIATPGVTGGAAGDAAALVPPKSAPANASGIELVGLTSPIGRNTDAKLAVRAAPGATCNIEVRYKSGPSKAKGLESKVASESGRATWTWRISRRTTPGTWPIEITCAMNNQTNTLAAAIVVKE